MRDFIGAAPHLGVSHLWFFSQTENNILLRLTNVGSGGPTIHFRVKNFLLSKVIKAAQKRPFDSASACKFN